jgi:hypothetical protein
MSGFKLQRLGLMMEPEPGNPREIEGVLNPAAARGLPDSLPSGGVADPPGAKACCGRSWEFKTGTRTGLRRSVRFGKIELRRNDCDQSTTTTV